MSIISNIDKLITSVNVEPGKETNNEESQLSHSLIAEAMTMTEKITAALSTECDTSLDCVIPHQIIEKIVTFVRGKLSLKSIGKPKDLLQAYGELNAKHQMEGHCFVQFKDGKTFTGHMVNGEMNGSYEYMIQAWAVKIGFEEMQLQKNKTFALVLDDKFEINFGLLESGSDPDVLIASYFKKFQIQKLGNDQRKTLYEKLLKANFCVVGTGRGALGICPRSESVVYTVTQPLKHMNVKAFGEAFDHIVKVCEKWEKDLAVIFK